jgi:hypothetical protein
MKTQIHRTLLLTSLALSVAALSACTTKVVEVQHDYYHTVTVPAPKPKPVVHHVDVSPENYQAVTPGEN